MNIRRDIDERFMKAALKEARAALECGEIPIGAVVVRGNEIIGRGHNDRYGHDMPFTHAEMFAIAEAMRVLGTDRLDGCTIYSTLEPCVMCAGAIMACRISALVYAVRDPRSGACGSLYDVTRDPRLRHKCKVTENVLRDEALCLIQDFYISKRRRDSR